MKKMSKKSKKKREKGRIRPPVVAVLGHVDHGKTTLLDKIRKTNVVSTEEGGITQEIGAWRVELGDKKRSITFIDTPGHEAFSKMRERGGRVADMAVLVVAADDGVMPQTVESIKHIKKAGIPFVVAISKMDLEKANADRVRKGFSKHNVLVEEMGGDVVCVEVSAKTGKGIEELLEMIFLVAEMEGLKYEPEKKLEGVVIESEMDKKRGILASVLIKKGVLKQGEEIVVEGKEARVRAMFNDRGERVEEAGPSIPVMILGFKKIPQVGAVVRKKGEEDKLETGERRLEERKERGEFSEEDLLEKLMEKKEKKFKLIVKTDTAGSLEAVIEGLPDKCEVIFKGAGEVVEKDVNLAKASKAIIVGFKVGVNKNAGELARTEGVLIKTYGIIYKLLEEIEEVVRVLEKPVEKEEILGKAEIKADFSNPAHRIAGCKVIEGKIAKTDKIKILRGKKEIGKTNIGSIRKVKEDVDRVDKNDECGIVFDPEVDFRVGDMVVSYRELRKKEKIANLV